MPPPEEIPRPTDTRPEFASLTSLVSGPFFKGRLSQPQSKVWVFGVAFFSFVALCTALVIQYSCPPSYFPTNIIVTIPSGTGITQAGNILAERGVIRSAFFYKAYIYVFVRILHRGNGIQAGQYLFDQPLSVLDVVQRTVNGVQGLSRIKMTVPEGSSSKDISRILTKAFAHLASQKSIDTGVVASSSTLFSTTEFLSLARLYEGYLFPDTYFLYQNSTAEQIISLMTDNFAEQIKTLSTTTASFQKNNKKTLSDIVTMASLVEREATSTHDRQIIAGILWKRLADNFPLQVDPPFYYLLGKSSAQLTLDDLKVKSPYNLYTHTGLPPTPIDNPGLDALSATINPTDTKYWYYLSDKKGNMHYAVTYEQHLENKIKYIK
jgi:UPF0755 protein